MVLVVGIVVALLLSVMLAVIFGPPYLPTLNKQVNTALDLLDLKPGQTMLELGCGDGRVLIAAAKRGINVVGIEISPLLAFIAWLRTRRYGKRVRVTCGNYFLIKWPPVDAIFTFMLPRQMPKLDKKIQNLRQPMRLASFAFEIPNKKPKAKKDGVFLYIY
jgi:SAM-dependent methyltransferase